MGNGAMVIQNAFDKNLDFAAALFFAKQPSRNHLGIIKNQQITLINQIDKIGKLPIDYPSGITIHT